MDKTKSEFLFEYYIEQTRHTENLRLEFTKFFSGLVSAIAVGGAFLLQNASDDYSNTVLGMVAGAGVVFCLLANVTLWKYQQLIREWVAAKNALEEEYLKSGSAEELAGLRKVRQTPINRPVVVMYVAVLPFLVMALLFGVLFFFPGLLAACGGK